MSTQVTLSVRSIVVTVVVALALVAAYLLGGSGGGRPASAAEDETAPAAERRVITMTGTGEASAVPDQLSFTVSVGVTRPDLDDALEAANATTTRVLDSLQDFDVAKDDVQTTGLSMNPVYDYPSSGPAILRGYRVSQRASVLVDDLKQGGAAVSAAVDAGGNDVRVDNIRLLVGDPDEVQAQARDAAVEEATAKAEQYAAAAGQDLGAVVTLREVRSKPLPTAPAAYESAADSASRGLSSVPIRAGRDETSVTVQLVWELS